MARQDERGDASGYQVEKHHEYDAYVCAERRWIDIQQAAQEIRRIKKDEDGIGREGLAA